MLVTEENSIIVDSLESFLRLILNSRNDAVRQETHLYFRGENRYNKYIVPSLYLDENLSKKSSEYYYRVLLSQIGCADYSKSSDLFKYMVDFEHHGAKTRILDISANPLIALYFAVENSASEDGYVYVFGSFHKEDRPDSNAEQFDVGHTVAVKTALNLISQDKINEFMNTCKSIYARTSRNDWNQLRFKDIGLLPFNSDDNNMNQLSFKDITSLQINSSEYIAIQTFMDLLNQRAKTSVDLVYPFNIYEDLQLAHIIIPSNCSDRLRMHQGAFIFPKYVQTEGKSLNIIQKEIDRSVNTLSANIVSNDGRKVNVIKIPGDKKAQIKKDLANVGISEGFVYSDIEHRSNTLLETNF
ncbi:MAG: FRG domain-containing protein [Saccharofermentans sp.]|nr:FRG domain-containing protein [Saccharofermentans sp.]